jgi:2'-5' RNA ligase
VPPTTDLGRLSLLMRRLGDPSPLPHITVIEPPLLSDDHSWQSATRDVVAQSEPITISVGEPRTFGDRVLYLAVDAPELHKLRRHLLDAIAPAGDGSRVGETHPYVPHLTLALAHHGGSLPRHDTLDLFPLHVDAFMATQLTLFRRDDARDRYRAWQRFPLAASRSPS